MYQTGKRYLTEQIGNALSVAESAVNHFLPDTPPLKPVPYPHDDLKEAPSSYPTPNDHLPPSHSQPLPPFHQGHPESGYHHHHSHSPPPPHHHHSDTLSIRERSPEVSLGRVQKIGSKVQHRIKKNAITRWNALYVKSKESVDVLENTVSLVKSAQIHIQTQTDRLNVTLSQMQLYIESKAVGLTAAIQQQANEALKGIASLIQSIQKEMVDSLKRAVEAISSGAAVMPSYAQTKIKEFIMSLPSRWAAMNASAQGLIQDDQRFLNHGHQVAKFGNESSQMLKAVVDIFSQYLEKAKSILDSLKVTSAPTSPSEMLTSAPTSPSQFTEDLKMTSRASSPDFEVDQKISELQRC